MKRSELESVIVIDVFEEAEERAYGRPWLQIWPPQVHRTYLSGRRGPYRGLVQALIEDRKRGTKGCGGCSKRK